MADRGGVGFTRKPAVQLHERDTAWQRRIHNAIA
jgi:hypothetical protein